MSAASITCVGASTMVEKSKRASDLQATARSAATALGSDAFKAVDACANEARSTLAHARTAALAQLVFNLEPEGARSHVQVSLRHVGPMQEYRILLIVDVVDVEAGGPVATG